MKTARLPLLLSLTGVLAGDPPARAPTDAPSPGPPEELETFRTLLDGLPPGTWTGRLPPDLLGELARGEAGEEALALLRRWEEAAGPPAIEPGGELAYRLDAGTPVVLVRPAQLSLIRLEPGETLRDAFLGDPARWKVEAALSGSGAAASPVLVVSALHNNLTTSLVAVTDRRSYRLQLVSSSLHHMPRVTFRYPRKSEGALDRKVSALEKGQRRLEGLLRELAPAPPSGPVQLGVARLDFDYEVTGPDRIPWKPLHVYNDGVRTYIVMPGRMPVERAPVFLLREGRHHEPVNYRLRHNRFVIDRLFAEGALVSGTGRRQQEVRIRRRPAGGWSR